MFLVSCGYAPIDNTTPIIITDIETAVNGENGKNCNYYGYGNTYMTFTLVGSNFKFRDTCGKFQIGDTLNIVKQ